jgi:hypothetical protein
MVTYKSPAHWLFQDAGVPGRIQGTFFATLNKIPTSDVSTNFPGLDNTTAVAERMFAKLQNIDVATGNKLNLGSLGHGRRPAKSSQACSPPSSDHPTHEVIPPAFGYGFRHISEGGLAGKADSSATSPDEMNFSKLKSQYRSCSKDHVYNKYCSPRGRPRTVQQTCTTYTSSHTHTHGEYRIGTTKTEVGPRTEPISSSPAVPSTSTSQTVSHDSQDPKVKLDCQLHGGCWASPGVTRTSTDTHTRCCLIVLPL